ncbi:MAG: glycosyltransferase, partial [Bacteroidota bacterium]|nr:glycosyltransferase [Bacteroidota bacterium]
MKIFFPVLNWGLGHASRSLPLIRKYLDLGHDVLPASDGEALTMLRQELPNLKVLQLPGYGIHYSSKYMPFNMLRYGPGMLKAMKAEHDLTKAIVKREQIDCIISDNRYGCYLEDVPSALITHQLQVFTGQKLLDVYIRRQIRGWCKNFDEIWIPDQAPPNSITGELTDQATNPIPKHYLGIISELSSSPSTGPYDAVAVISGPEPQRTHFEQLVIKQLILLEGRYAVVCGKPGTDEIKREENNLTIIPYLSRAELSELLNQTEVVIARSGYTTLMDLARTGHKAILCPTPGQYEQIYLADRLASLGQCVYKRQENLNLQKALAEVVQVNPIRHDGNV